MKVKIPAKVEYPLYSIAGKTVNVLIKEKDLKTNEIFYLVNGEFPVLNHHSIAQSTHEDVTNGLAERLHVSPDFETFVGCVWLDGKNVEELNE